MANVLLGASAGIALYKSVELASRLTQRGDAVRTILTPNAARFVAPLTFRAVTRQEVYVDTFDDDPAYRPEHISLSDWADVLVIAPATADLLGKLACGLGDNLLTATALAFNRPVVVAPSMNDRMWAHPIVQANVARLREALSYRFVGPDDGYLACGAFGPGRLSAPEAIEAAIDSALASRPSG
jgi:phosphopantothenoylcysteine decarboxylase/phosphopantothenate--cysteine ligase